MIKLQNILFPESKFNPVIEAFVKVQGKSNIAVDLDYLKLNKNSKANFVTYFNGFSVEKWKKYSIVNRIGLHLELTGDCQVKLINAYRENNANVINELSTVTYEGCENDYCADIPLPEFIDRGIISFVVTALSDEVTVKGGYYYADIDATDIDDVYFAIDICSFKREKYVQRNMNILAETIFNEKSGL